MTGKIGSVSEKRKSALNKLRCRLFSLSLFCFLLVGCVSNEQPLVQSQPPNVLFIAVDDLRPELGIYGSRALTPNIDRLAAEGLRFDRAYCNQAVCGASRTSLMTGLYPEYTNERSAHVVGWRDRHADVVTLNQLFKENGYETVGIGKVYHSWEGQKADGENWTRWVETEGAQYYVDEATIEEGRKQADAFGVQFKRGPTTEAAESDNAGEIYHDGFRASAGVRELEKLTASDQPFFLAVGFSKPHLPFSAPVEFWDLYDRDDFSMPENLGVPEGYPEYARNAKPGELRVYSDVPPSRDPKEFSEEMNKRLIHGYHACVSYTDHNIGMLLDALERSGKADNTIIVFWSDHGWKLGDHASWCKHTNFECDTRVPLLIVDPRLENVRGETDALVELIDLYPTLAELCALEQPAHLQGKSFLPVLKDPSLSHRDYAYSSYPRRPNDDIIGHSIRNDRYRYTEWWDVETDEVLDRVATDLVADPGETTNALLEQPELADAFSPDLREIVIQARTLPSN